MIVEIWTRKRGTGNEDEKDVEDTTRYKKSSVRLA
jgi:hypothetical protein